jgi:hypothetical protein
LIPAHDSIRSAAIYRRQHKKGGAPVAAPPLILLNGKSPLQQILTSTDP